MSTFIVLAYWDLFEEVADGSSVMRWSPFSAFQSQEKTSTQASKKEGLKFEGGHEGMHLLSLLYHDVGVDTTGQYYQTV